METTGKILSNEPWVAYCIFHPTNISPDHVLGKRRTCFQHKIRQIRRDKHGSYYLRGMTSGNFSQGPSP